MRIYLLMGAVLLLLKGCAGGPPPEIEFVAVNGGCYQMGDTFGDGDPDERPVHEVCVKDFSLGKYEVTQGQWNAVMGKKSHAEDRGPDYPIYSVSWNMIQQFLTKLNRASGMVHRLPTEAEWEYAARSGGKEERWSGTNNSEDLGNFAWTYDNYGYVPHRVGQKRPNGLGLYDMSGNVAEWCQDWYDETYYQNSPKQDPRGPETGEKRVVRGGGPYSVRDVRTSDRLSDPPDMRDGDYGFRLVREKKK